MKEKGGPLWLLNFKFFGFELSAVIKGMPVGAVKVLKINGPESPPHIPKGGFEVFQEKNGFLPEYSPRAAARKTFF